ncbi:hypothetical protein V6N13_035033 [Hibiscus sabdariffa]
MRFFGIWQFLPAPWPIGTRCLRHSAGRTTSLPGSDAASCLGPRNFKAKREETRSMVGPVDEAIAILLDSKPNGDQRPISPPYAWEGTNGSLSFLSLNVAKNLKVFLLLMPTDPLEEGSQGDLASDYRNILFLGNVHEDQDSFSSRDAALPLLSLCLFAYLTLSRGTDADYPTMLLITSEKAFLHRSREAQEFLSKARNQPQQLGVRR